MCGGVRVVGGRELGLYELSSNRTARVFDMEVCGQGMGWEWLLTP